MRKPNFNILHKTKYLSCYPWTHASYILCLFFRSSFLFLYASFFFPTHLFVASPFRPPCRIPDTRSSLPRLSPSLPDKILGGISHVRPVHVRSVCRKCIPVSLMRAIPKPIVSIFKIIDCPLLSVLENRGGVLHDLETSSGGRVIQVIIRVVLQKRARQILLRLALEVEGSAEDLAAIVLDGFETLLDGLFGHEDI